MPSLSVSSVAEVLEDLRIRLVSDLLSQNIEVPDVAQKTGAAFEAMLAFQRLSHRRVPALPRAVTYSPNITTRALGSELLSALDHIRGEFERGDDMTQRLTRHFFRAGFNDFLFNNYRIQHLHLGPRNSARDKTRKHFMASGGNQLLFAWITDSDAYFLDIMSHNVFDSPSLSKELVRTALRNRPDFVLANVAPGVVGSEQTFEDAFELAKLGFTAGYEIDGHFFLTGGTVMDGKVRDRGRGPGTSFEAVDAANLCLNEITRMVQYLQKHADGVAEVLLSATGVRPQNLTLQVIDFGRITRLMDGNSGAEFVIDGTNQGYRVPGMRKFVPLRLRRS